MKWFIGKSKRSVDNTVDAYLGRAAFALSLLAAIGFALAGTWLVLVDLYGTTVTCFALAGILIVLSFIINLTIVASERAAERDIEDVERTIEDSGLARPLPRFRSSCRRLRQFYRASCRFSNHCGLSGRTRLWRHW